ncbi:MAG: pilin [Patescibacteria group bacterium]|jgi:hypothetical protein
MNKKTKKLFLLILFIIAIFLPNIILAAWECPGGTMSYGSADECNTSGCAAGCQMVTEPSSGGTVTLDNPLGKGNTDIPTLLGKVINSIMGVIGSLALVMFIYGGIIWMLSAGNQEQVTKGKNILIWAAVGIVIIFSSYALVKLVLTAMVS